MAEIITITIYTLIDPEVGVERLPRRVAGLAWLSAKVFGLPLEVFTRIYGPLEDLEAWGETPATL